MLRNGEKQELTMSRSARSDTDPRQTTDLQQNRIELVLESFQYALLVVGI